MNLCLNVSTNIDQSTHLDSEVDLSRFKCNRPAMSYCGAFKSIVYIMNKNF